MSGRGSIAGWRTVAEDGVTSGKYRFQAGDVLYSKIRPNLNKVATAPFSGLCSADMYALVPRASVATAPYLEHVLRTPAFLGYADRLSNRANIPKLNRKQLESYVAPLPPIALQDDFARRIDAVRSTRQSVEAAQVVDDAMFASLQSRAFRGEL
jgi:type I restriction enzyme S subunit